jgi:aminomethyltransferase
MSLKRTALYEEHRKLNGRLIDFGGWELPVQYTGVMDEHIACRTAAGLFDVSHMGEVIVEGVDAEKYLYHLVANDITKVAIGQAQYSPLCHPHGGIIDDLIVYKRAADRFLVVVNASNTEKDFTWMQKVHREGGFRCRLENESPNWSQIAVQGPKAEKILQKLTKTNLSEIKTYRFAEGEVSGVTAIIARTGYTGEDGFEVYVAWEKGGQIWSELLKAGTPEGLKPCGLGARDTLRLEAKYPLYGQELTDETNPIEAGIGWAVKLDKADFVGKSAIAAAKAAGLKRKLVGIELTGAGIPRTGYRVLDASGTRQVGHITSGTQSPSLKKPIGIAYVELASAEIGTPLRVEIRANQIPAEVVATPFYKKST